MNGFVWFTSYLCIFMLGGIASLAAAYYLIEKMTDKAEVELRVGAGMGSLQERLAPYGHAHPNLN